MPWNDNVRPGPWGPTPEGGDSEPENTDKGTGQGEGATDGGDKRPDPGPSSPWGGLGGATGGSPAGGSKPRGPTLGRPSGPRRLGARPGPGGGRKAPELEQLSREWRARAERFFRNPNGRGVRPGAVAAVAGAAVGLWALSGVYIVQPNEQAVVTRFGAYVRSESPGLKVRLPWPIETAVTVPVTTIRRIDVGGRSGSADRAEESLMLTGDENIVDMDFSVTWRVSDADNYLFRTTNPDATVKAVAESAMREVVGRTPLNDVLSSGRARVQLQTEALMQRILDNYRTGVRIEQVQIRAAEPPQQVITSFREVASAGQEAQSFINEANTYRNRVVNEAVGSAAAIRQEAEGYRQSVVSEAEGEAARFNQIVAQYRANPGVTRERLYVETMERVLRDSNKIVIDQGQGGNAPIILPPELFRNRPAPTAAGGTTSAQPSTSQSSVSAGTTR
jgi:membrane protease subunit HflK